MKIRTGYDVKLQTNKQRNVKMLTFRAIFSNMSIEENEDPYKN